jgi:hypothetical protein
MARAVWFGLVLTASVALAETEVPTRAATPPELTKLAQEFRSWRRGERAGVPDYATQAAERRRALPEWHRRLEALKRDDWPVSVKVDALVVQQEMDDLDFDLNVTREVSRNPDFYIEEAARAVSRNVGGRYQSGPTVTVPYDAKRADAILAGLKSTAAIVDQAPKNLSEAVPEMADMAIERLADVRKDYDEFARVVSPHVPEAQRAQIGPAADEAGAAMEKYREWLKANRSKMTAPYTIGRKAFEWYVRRVLMMPYDSEQLLTQAAMERDRGWAFLALEQQKNRALPKIGPARDNREYSEWKDATDVLSRMWAEELDLFTRPSYVGAMRDADGAIWIEPFGMMAFPTQSPPKGTTKTEFLTPPDHWFSHIYWEKGHRLDPGINHPHSDYPGHTFEGAVSQKTTNDIRRGHNSRGDAWTYYMEEVQLQTNYPFVHGPRVREWMYGLHIMRAERVYAAVKFADGSLTPDALAEHMMKSVPGMEPHVARKHEVWRKFTDPGQVLTYQVARSEVYELLGDRMKQLGDKFNLREFHDQLLATGQIPVSLARWEMTGKDDEVRYLWKYEPLPAPVPAAARGKK